MINQKRSSGAIRMLAVASGMPIPAQMHCAILGKKRSTQIVRIYANKMVDLNRAIDRYLPQGWIVRDKH